MVTRIPFSLGNGGPRASGTRVLQSQLRQNGCLGYLEPGPASIQKHSQLLPEGIVSEGPPLVQSKRSPCTVARATNPEFRHSLPLCSVVHGTDEDHSTLGFHDLSGVYTTSGSTQHQRSNVTPGNHNASRACDL